MQAHLGARRIKRLDKEVGCAHPELNRAERVLNGLSSLAHLLRVAIQSLLHGVDDCVMHPAPDASLRAGGALRLDRAAWACRTPVDAQRHPRFDGGEALDQALPSGAAIFIIAGDIDEVRFAEATLRLAIGVQRLGHEW